MKPLYTQEEYENCGSREYLNIACEFCGGPTKRTKHDIQTKEKFRPNGKYFCSKKCSNDMKLRELSHELICKQCKKHFIRLKSQTSKTNSFCSQSCACTYNTMHKKFGNRRSKLEVFLETELVKLYPNIEFHFNKKDTINSELDIYIPSLKLAFELNGIFHYEPIYGSEKLESIKNNDQRKFQACLENNIELCIIDSSKLKYFKYENAKPYLDIITNIIDFKITLVR